jgi:superfamily I DNA and/or RNA helicase
LKRLTADLQLGSLVDAGTVHRYQGNEKEMMVIDIPDRFGEARPGWWLDDEQPDEDGARLFNVAISRSQHRLVFVVKTRNYRPQSVLLGMLSHAQVMEKSQLSR